MALAAVQELIENDSGYTASGTEQHLQYLAIQILHNLKHQHRWTELTIHQRSPLTGAPLARPLVSGLPPSRLYVHPDEQIEILRVEAKRKKRANDARDSSHSGAGSDEDGRDDGFAKSEREWVLPTQLAEKWSLRKFAEVFDAISILPPTEDAAAAERTDEIPPSKWRLTKRVLLATLSDDSTVVYYIVHNGLVKPRQN